MIELFGFSVALDIKLALMCGVVFVAGIIRGFLGFGSALLIVPAVLLAGALDLAAFVGAAQVAILAVVVAATVDAVIVEAHPAVAV